MNHKLVCCVALTVTLLTACAAPVSEADAARQTLIAFFSHLTRGEYAAADALYGGKYDQLRIFNPDLDPADRSALWRNACEVSGLQCLKVNSAVLKRQAGNTFTFAVDFRRPDGSGFVLGPCCGATATEMPPVSHFDYRVQRTPEGGFVVLDLPVYMP